MKSIQQHTKPFAAALYQMIQVERRCSQKQLADTVGYKQASISALMLEKTEGVEKKRRKIAEFFGFQYEEFLSIGQKIIDKQEELLTISEPTAVADIVDEARKRHQIVIEGFEDKEWALAVNEMLVEIEKRAPELKKIVKGSIENFFKNLPEIEETKKTGTTNKPES